MNAEKLKEVLRLHAMWLRGEEGGVRADLRNEDLRQAYLWGESLRRADLRGAGLRRAHLRHADLRRADLRHADLQEADLRDANLQGADLQQVNLRWANLPHFQIPDGDIIGWKKLNGAIVKLLIPLKARRTASLVGRKCRAEWAKVLEIEGRSLVYGLKRWEYKVGGEVRPDEYDDDIRVECTHGIHFFLTRREAEEWSG